MRVICIDDDWKGNDILTKEPKFNEICTPKDCREGEPGTWYYKLLGFMGWWETSAFIPLSTIDETHFERNIEKIGV